MTKEVTSTTVKLAKIDMVEGQPQAIELEPMILLGNVNEERAQKLVAKKHGTGVTVLSVEADTKVYEMEVAEFIQIARLKEVDQVEAQQI